MLRNNGIHNFRSPYGIQPSLILDFAQTGALDPRITFTRSTTAKYYNSSGILSTAAINAPRFDYNPSTLAPLGLFVEPSSTNLILYSEQFDNPNWTALRATITPNSTVSPDGTSNADLILDTAVAGTHVLIQVIAKTATAIAYNASVYLKAFTRNNGELRMSDQSGNGIRVVFDLNAGTASSPIAFGTGYTVGASSIEPVGNSWYRVSVSGTSNLSLINSLEIYIANASLAISYVGDGSGFYAFGADLESSLVPTSYITTVASQVSRSNDLPSLPIDTWYNTSQGTWFAQFSTVSIAGTPRIVGATPSSKAPIFISSQAASMFDSTTTISTANTITANTTQKIASSWSGTSGSVCLNGGTVVTGSQPTGYADLTTIGIGYNSTSNNNFINGRISKISYYPKQLTSAQLQALTT